MINRHNFGLRGARVKLRWCGVAFWKRCPCGHSWSVVVLWWFGCGVFINSPRYCRNFGVVLKRPTPFDKLP